MSCYLTKKENIEIIKIFKDFIDGVYFSKYNLNTTRWQVIDYLGDDCNNFYLNILTSETKEKNDLLTEMDKCSIVSIQTGVERAGPSSNKEIIIQVYSNIKSLENNIEEMKNYSDSFKGVTKFKL